VSNDRAKPGPQREARDLLDVCRSGRDLTYWHTRPFITPELRARIASVPVLIVPQEGFGDFKGPVFPVATAELFRFAQGKVPAHATIEVCISDEDYKELALHESIIIVATIAIGSLVVAPVVVNIVSEYLRGRLFSPEKEKTTTAKFKLIVSETSTKDAKHQAIEMQYEGPVDKLEPTLLAKIKQLKGPTNGGSNV
jgi:hypothetical protein